uniref:Uncharacterized protein n=1 Tax=Rhizophora mucronata TaxID=61149 RepID=A0A2P2KZ97_RHIMU
MISNLRIKLVHLFSMLNSISFSIRRNNYNIIISE